MAEISNVAEQTDVTTTMKLVGFRVGGEEFGVDILKVQEIIRMVDITRVPNAPDYVEGIISLRGRVIPVIDFRRRFNMEGNLANDMRERRIVISSIGDNTIGMMVDQVSEVIDIAGQDISPAPQAVKGMDSAFIKGLGKRGKRLLIILALDEVFTHCQVEAMARAA